VFAVLVPTKAQISIIKRDNPEITIPNMVSKFTRFHLQCNKMRIKVNPYYLFINKPI